jgi:hypothetical protein
MSEYEQNRAQHSSSEWERFDGQWVALSSDGRQIFAAAPTLEELGDKLARLNKRAEEVAFERVELDDCCLGGTELL